MFHFLFCRFWEHLILLLTFSNKHRFDRISHRKNNISLYVIAYLFSLYIYLSISQVHIKIVWIRNNFSSYLWYIFIVHVKLFQVYFMKHEYETCTCTSYILSLCVCVYMCVCVYIYFLFKNHGKHWTLIIVKINFDDCVFHVRATDIFRYKAGRLSRLSPMKFAQSLLILL